MDTTKNDQERAKYTRLIGEKEETIDQLKLDKRKVEDSLQNLQTTLQRSYRKLAMLNEEDLRDGNQENRRMQRQEEEQEHFFKRELGQAEANLSESYKEQAKLLEDEKEKLYEKRGEISWD